MSTITLPDRFDVHEIPAFRELVRGGPGDVVVDLGEVRFLDAEALRALVETRADAIVAGHDLVIRRLSTAAQVTLEMTGLTAALPVAHELAEAA